MSTLHTITRSWHDATWLFEQLAFAQKGDAILLYQDAVLALQSPLSLASFEAKCRTFGVSVFALKSDCEIRGVDNQYPDISIIDDAGFVDLVVQHTTQCCW